jgi:glucose 1-dehydrogenase
MDPNKKVVLITGAASGIGRATATLFQDEGWAVVAVDRNDVALDGVLTIAADVSKVEDCDRIAAEVSSRYAGLHGLVNNAARQLVRPLIETEPEEWDSVLDTNLKAAYLLVRQLHPVLKQARGAIINLASIHAEATSPGMAVYAASKGALVSLTRAMALEFAPDGIRVNAVLPGAIDTPMLAEGLERRRPSGVNEGSPMEQLAASHPLGRVGRPEEVAHAISFLADPVRASFITGQSLIIDGGASARLSTE